MSAKLPYLELLFERKAHHIFVVIPLLSLCISFLRPSQL